MTVDRSELIIFARDAYAEQGYDDASALTEAIYDEIVKAKVTKKADRYTGAIPKETLMSKVFSLVPGPDEWEEQDDPEMAGWLYRELRARVWKAAGVYGPVQTLLGERDGHMLCRVGGPRGSMVYITKDQECMKLDYWDHIRESRVAQATKDGKYAAEMIRRGFNEEWVAKMLDDQLRAALNEGRTHVRLLNEGGTQKGSAKK
jgi:hypothetical protein